MPLPNPIEQLAAKLQERMRAEGFMSTDDMNAFMLQVGAAIIASTRQAMLTQGATDADIHARLADDAAKLDDCRVQAVAQFKSFCVRQRARMH